MSGQALIVNRAKLTLMARLVGTPDSRNPPDSWSKACADFGAYSRNPLDSWSKACADFGAYSRNPPDSWSKIREILLIRGQRFAKSS